MMLASGHQEYSQTGEAVSLDSVYGKVGDSRQIDDEKAENL